MSAEVSRPVRLNIRLRPCDADRLAAMAAAEGYTVAEMARVLISRGLYPPRRVRTLTDTGPRWDAVEETP